MLARGVGRKQPPPRQLRRSHLCSLRMLTYADICRRKQLPPRRLRRSHLCSLTRLNPCSLNLCSVLSVCPLPHLRARRAALKNHSPAQVPQFTCFTRTKVQILTPRAALTRPHSLAQRLDYVGRRGWRQHTSAYEHLSACVSIRQHTSAH
jgi:hypothetical protein